MLKVVPTVRTKFSTQDLTKSLIESWHDSYNELPKKEQIGVIFSQWALETGLGNSCWNFNLGNVKAVDDPNSIIEYCMLSNVWEIINGQKVIFQPPHPATWFRAFPTLKDGVMFHLDFLKNHRYKSSWSAIEAGDPAQFAHLLKMQHYYTAPEADYVKAMNIYFKKFMADPTFEQVIAQYNPAPVVPAPTPDPVVVAPSPPPPPAPANNTSGIGDVISKVWSWFGNK